MGRAEVAFGLSAGVTRLADLAQTGSARVLLPRVAGDRPEAVFLNTSGGLTSGDQISFAMHLGDGARLSATTQTAERAYLARGPAARMTVTADVGANAELDWLPQETILFEDSHLDRTTQIDLAPGARCLMLELVILGRRAMGEDPRRARLTDRRLVTVAGRPLWAENLRLDPAALAMAGTPALLGPGTAFATLALCGPGAEGAADALRLLPAPDCLRVGVSGWNGRTLLRTTGPDPWVMKLYLGRAIARLTNRPLPRVWQMTNGDRS